MTIDKIGLTIDEAIEHCEKEAEEFEQICKENDNYNFHQPKWRRCAKEHRQLADWLKDYKKLSHAVEEIKAEIENVKSVMNEEIINHDRKDLINFVNGLNQCMCIIDSHISEKRNHE